MHNRLFKASRIAAVAFILAAAAILVSCEDFTITISGVSGGTSHTTEISLSVPRTELDCLDGSQFLTIKSSEPWTMTLEYPEDVEPWATLKFYEGEKDAVNTMYWTLNTSEFARTCTIVLQAGEAVIESVVTQKPRVIPQPQELEPDPVPHWMELPATNDPGRYFFTHDMTIGTKTCRNYSFYLDPEALVSVWVAYPLNKSLIGSGTRTDAWGETDPKVPNKYQALLGSAYKGGYDRGHQIPSADRLTREANKATFYGTNMTPQRGVLNQQAWATLEGKVRTWASSFDTLYVVTGADIVGSTQVAYDNAGKAVTVPVGYFKALLGYKSGASSVQFPSQKGGYLAIGFYMEHRAYSDSEIMGTSMTIDQLEEKTGFDFFVNLPDDLEPLIESTKSTWWN